MTKVKSNKIIRAPSLKEQVCENLRRAVFEGVFPMGDHLTEEKVAEYLGVSRTPVREALNTLAFEGILSPREKRGYDLFTPTAKQMEETFRVRELLEPDAIASVVKNTDAKHIQSLREIVEAEVTAEGESNPREFSIQNLNFRQTLYEKCGNIYIQEILAKFDHFSFYVVLWSIRARSELREFNITNQQDIIQALEKRDVDLARAGVMAYLMKGRANVSGLHEDKHINA